MMRSRLLRVSSLAILVHLNGGVVNVSSGAVDGSLRTATGSGRRL